MMIRKIDDLGRIVIPKEIRSKLGTREGDQFEIDVVTDPVSGRRGYSVFPYCAQSVNIPVYLPQDDHVFLTELSKELNEQPTDGNRDPRWWGIRQRRVIAGVDPENADYMVCYDGEDACDLDGRTKDDLIAELVKDYDYAESDFDACVDLTDVVETANEVAGERSSSKSYSRFDLVGCKVEYELVRGPMFLTKRACQEHIEKFGYNYDDPHPYVMTADRCPEYERLLQVLKNLTKI